MRTIYLKGLPSISFLEPTYYKIVEINNLTTQIVVVDGSSVEIKEEEDFFEEVSFVKNKAHKENGCLEITKKEFESKYMSVFSRFKKIIQI